MPVPRISPLFNNCILHCLTPEIKSVIDDIAQGHVHPDNPFYPSYEHLKQCFEAFYGIAPLSWRDYSDLVNQYNPFDLQLVMGPVLRHFMVMNAQRPDNSEMIVFFSDPGELEAFIFKHSNLSENGRFPTLDFGTVAQFIAYYLGFWLIISPANALYVSNHASLSQEQSLRTVNLYHSGDSGQYSGHWERSADDHERINYDLEDSSKLNKLSQFIDEDKLDNEFVLALIMRDVQARACKINVCFEKTLRSLSAYKRLKVWLVSKADDHDYRTFAYHLLQHLHPDVVEALNGLFREPAPDDRVFSAELMNEAKDLIEPLLKLNVGVQDEVSSIVVHQQSQAYLQHLALLRQLLDQKMDSFYQTKEDKDQASILVEQFCVHLSRINVSDQQSAQTVFNQVVADFNEEMQVPKNFWELVAECFRYVWRCFIQGESYEFSSSRRFFEDTEIAENIDNALEKLSPNRQ